MRNSLVKVLNNPKKIARNYFMVLICSLVCEQQYNKSLPKLDYRKWVKMTSYKDGHKCFYTVVYKNKTPNSCPYLCQIMTDFHNSFTVTLSRKFAIKISLQIPPHLNSVAAIPCEILMSDNTACPICWGTVF